MQRMHPALSWGVFNEFNVLVQAFVVMLALRMVQTCDTPEARLRPTLHSTHGSRWFGRPGHWFGGDCTDSPTQAQRPRCQHACIVRQYWTPSMMLTSSCPRQQCSRGRQKTAAAPVCACPGGGARRRAAWRETRCRVRIPQRLVVGRRPPEGGYRQDDGKRPPTVRGRGSCATASAGLKRERAGGRRAWGRAACTLALGAVRVSDCQRV